MYDGNQVVRVVSKYKKHDAYNIGIEMSERKGTGNYDKERTQFNIEYVGYKSVTKDTDWCSLIRQKINND